MNKAKWAEECDKTGDMLTACQKEIDDLRQLLVRDSNPCTWCGTRNNEHKHLYRSDIESYRRKGYYVRICEGPNWHDSLINIPGWTFRCVVFPLSLPENPCDSDFMEEIST